MDITEETARALTEALNRHSKALEDHAAAMMHGAPDLRANTSALERHTAQLQQFNNR